MILSVADLEAAASNKLADETRAFFNSGATNEITVKENRSAFSKYRIRPRVLRDVSNVQTEIDVLGGAIAFPLCVSPAGVQTRAHPEGELATSRACSNNNIHMGVSSFANNSVEDIIAAGRKVGGKINYAMQLYTMQDRDAEKAIIARAEEAGCKAIFLTADSPILRLRYNEKRSNFKVFDGIPFPMVENGWEDRKSQSHDRRFISFNSDSHSWDEIGWLRSVTKMEIWIKGVLTAEDVEMAIEKGCDGVIVSNHGGRQLDGVVPTIDALPECVKAARGRIRLHVDGGIRSGADIFKALALGAECCWVGRPMLWGLAYDGQKGVELMIDILYQEFRRCMQLAGCRTVAEITLDRISRIGSGAAVSRL